MKCLTVRQPWVHAIAHLGKDVENRPRRLGYRGELAVHAAGRWDGIDAMTTVARIARVHTKDIRVTDRHMSAVLVVADLVDCCDCDGSCSPWAFPDRFHLRLANVRVLAEPVPAVGRLGLWNLPGQVETAVRAQLPTTAKETP